MPCALAKIAELMPTTSPSMFSSGPPELPGLIEASVWMKSLKVRFSALKLRLTAETTPTVTVFFSPNGQPIS